MEPEQVSPDWGAALEAWCVEQALDTLGREGALEVSSVELAQPVLAGYSRPANVGRQHRTHLAVRTGDTVRRADARNPGPKRHTGGQER